MTTAARFRRRASMETADAWRHRHVLNITATGCAWGLGGALVFLAAPYPRSQAAVLVVVAAMTASALVYQGIVLRAYLGYLIGAIVPDALEELGIDYGQGCYLGEALPASEVTLPAPAVATRAGGGCV